MRKIVKTMLVAKPIVEASAFQGDLEKVIGLLQNEGLAVNVQYGHTDTHFSALITGEEAVR